LSRGAGRRNLALLSWLAFVVSLGFGAVSGILPYYMLYLAGELKELPEELGRISRAGSYAVEYGTLISVFMLTRAFLARYFGSASDRVGRKRLIVAGTALYVVVSLGYVAARSLPELYAVRGLQGVASAMVWPVAEALLMDSVDPERRGRSMAVYMVSTNLAMISGPAIGVAAYKLGVLALGLREVGEALRFPFLFLALFSSMGIPAAVLLVEERAGAGGAAGDRVEMEPWARRSVRALYVMAAANGVAMGFSGPLLSLFVVQHVSSDPTVLAVVSTLPGLAGLAAAYPAGRLSDTAGRKRVVLAAGALSRISTALLPLFRGVWELTALATLRSVAFNSLQPAMRALQADLVPEGVRGRVFGTFQAAFNVGAVVGPVLGGAVYSAFSGREIPVGPASIPGEAVSFWTGALIGAASLAVFAVFVREPERRTS